jgi:hypothetical protein
VKKGEKPLQQIVKRMMEMSAADVWFNSHRMSLSNQNPIFLKPHLSGPVPNGCDPSQQYRVLHLNFFKFTSSVNNSCCKLIDNSIVLIKNFVYSNALQSMAIVCKHFESISDFFNSPLPQSSKLGIFVVNNLSENLSVRRISDISEKMVLLELNNTRLVLPLLHSD